MKELLFAFLVFISSIFGTMRNGYFVVYDKLFPCSRAMHYRIDRVDPRFNLTNEQFAKEIEEAAGIWEKASGKDLFVYDPKGTLSINMIYDERQQKANQINSLENKVKIQDKTIAPKINEYESLSVQFRKKVAELGEQVQFWNQQGGAPPDVYQKLISQQEDLQEEADRLNQMAMELNLSTNQYNASVNDLNNKIGDFNQTLKSRPEEGLFMGDENRIEIYFNVSKDETVHTLAHELGHALGIGHVPNPESIMYVNTNQQTDLGSDDIEALKTVCKLE